MKRYEDIGNFWSERGAGKAEAETVKREEYQTTVAARRQDFSIMISRTIINNSVQSVCENR